MYSSEIVYVGHTGPSVDQRIREHKRVLEKQIITLVGSS